MVALVMAGLVGCGSDGPSREQRGGRTVQDGPSLIMIPNFDGNGNLLGFNQIWIPQSHCEGATS